MLIWMSQQVNRNCPHIDCVRHNKNTPFNVQFLRENYSFDKNGECKYKLTDWSDAI